MYVPAIYEAHSDEWSRRIIESYPLALLVTNAGTFPHATHVPVIPERGMPAAGSLVGTMLRGHMNRANPHWRSLEGPTPARLVFFGPHSYITPTVYATTPAAPTWNFVSVHIAGTLTPITGIDNTLDVVRDTVAAFETTFGDAWSPHSSEQYFREIIPGVGAFHFQVEALDAMFKLSQEKTPEIQTRVMDRLRNARAGVAHDLADLMGAFYGSL